MKIKKEEIKNACDLAYSSIKENAYFGNGFTAGVDFVLSKADAQEAENKELREASTKLIEMYKSVVKFVEWKKLAKELDTHVNLDWADEYIIGIEEKIKQQP